MLTTAVAVELRHGRRISALLLLFSVSFHLLPFRSARKKMVVTTLLPLNVGLTVMVRVMSNRLPSGRSCTIVEKPTIAVATAAASCRIKTELQPIRDLSVFLLVRSTSCLSQLYAGGCWRRMPNPTHDAHTFIHTTCQTGAGRCDVQ